jgi:BirA family biotin operon repressor/biotin-[acetyl-CoA-carboxylase] ligase
MRPRPARVPFDPRRAGGRPGSEQPPLRADRLDAAAIQAGLRTRWLARTLHLFEEVDSTNRVAQELARQGAVPGTTVIAESQSAGRGRLGRSFFSPPHQNLYTSIVLHPTATAADASAFVLAAAVAVADTVAAFVRDPSRVEIKWPNDVQVDGLKVSGILLELGSDGARVAHLVMGIGVNLNAPRESLPEEFRGRASSLRSCLGAPVDRAAFVRDLYERLEPILERCAERGFGGVLPAFEAHFRMRGRAVRVADLAGRTQDGVVTGVAPDGALRLRTGAGEIRVVAGDVTILKEPA